MDFSFLNKEFQFALNNIDTNKLTEIRLRVNQPIICKINNARFYLSNNGIDKSIDNAFICSKKDIFDIVEKLTEYSIYAFNEQIISGYITTKDCIRIGICGECVFNNDKISCMKNFTSLIIRIPHLIENCSYDIFTEITKKQYIIA